MVAASPERLALSAPQRVKAALFPAGVALVIAVPTVLIALGNPHQAGRFPACPFLTLTGMYCPGCGGTRAVYELAHLDFLGALQMNPLFTVAAPLLIVIWLRWLLRGQGWRLKPWPFPTVLAFIIPGTIVAFTVMRNMALFAPWLAPGS